MKAKLKKRPFSETTLKIITYSSFFNKVAETGMLKF